MGTAFKYPNGHPKCGREAGLLLQSPGGWGEKVACFKSLKARITVQAALGGGEFPMLGDSSRGNICQGYPTAMAVNLPFAINPAGGEWKLGPASYLLHGSPLRCLHKDHPRLPEPFRAAQSELSSL